MAAPMISLVKYLCTVFKCDADALPDIIRQHPHKVFDNVKDLHLYYSPASRKNDELTPVKADGYYEGRGVHLIRVWRSLGHYRGAVLLPSHWAHFSPYQAAVHHPAARRVRR